MVDAAGNGSSFSAAAAVGGHEWRWPLDIVHSVQTRRYLLRRSALENCLLDRSAYFIDLRSQEQRMRVYSTIAGLKPKHSAPMFLEAASPETLLKNPSHARWCARDEQLRLSHGAQHPRGSNVTTSPSIGFPWVIADYTSQELDQWTPRRFVFPKPVGALNKNV